MAEYTKEEVAILSKEYPSGGVKQVQKYIKRTPDSIRHKAKALNITREENFRLSKKDFSDFFTIQNPEIAYLLGLIWGDGHVFYKTNEEKTLNNNRSYIVSFTIKTSDFEDIKNICGYFTLKKVQIKSHWKELTKAYIYSKKLAY